MPLQLKHRPKSLTEFIGNAPLKDSLSSIFNRVDKPHAYLIAGQSGSGKTTIARIIAKAYGCEDIDLYEYNSANLRGIDTIRDIQEKSPYAAKGPCKVYILDECHSWPQITQEAALKMLEDVPKNVYYILATTNPEKLLSTIRTRCTTFSTMPLTMDEMRLLLTNIASKEKIQLDSTILESIVKAAEGCAREAVKLLDQISTMTDKAQQLALIASASVGDTSVEVRELCQRLFKNDVGISKWFDVRAILAKINEPDPERVRRMILGYLGMILTKVNTNEGGIRVARLMNEFKDNFFNSGKNGLQMACFLACQIGA